MSGSAPKQAGGYLRDFRAGCVGWIGFSLLLVILYLGIQRFTQLDTWKLREPLAKWLVFDRWVILPDIAAPGTEVAGRNRGVERLDADGDGFTEYVVRYKYDLTVQRSPVAIAIYDNDRGTPAVLYPYRLKLPDRDYTGENDWWGTKVLIGDFIKGDTTGTQEIQVHGDGPPEEVSLFRYEPSRKAPEWSDPRDNPPVYRCIGFFRGDAVMQPDANNRVIVKHRTYDRSQLARVEAYEYNAARDSYLDADGKALLPYSEVWIDFAFAEPVDVEASEYPEKVVLAYYKRFPTGDYMPLMSTLARERAKLAAQTQNVSVFGLPIMPANVERILVQNIAYSPQAENIPYVDIQGQTHYGAVVHVEFLYTVKDDLTQAKKTHSANWFVIQEKGKWKLDHVEP